MPVLGLSAVFNVISLAQNGYANVFYAAGVKSMLRSLHNFAFVSFDPGGLVMVDKPPLGLWVQAASAKLFGFAPLSLLLPEAIIGVLVVAVLYRALERRLGWIAALAGALALAVFPSFVAVSRDNGVDPLLILLMALACDAGLRAVESGRWRSLLWAATLVGLAFNTKTLAAYLVVPGVALAYAVCGPGRLARRAGQLAVAAALMLAVSFSWIAFVELVPASSRPYVGGSTNNRELGLTFEYNGFGRVGGQAGGPGRIPVKEGALVRARRLPGASAPGAHHAAGAASAPAAGRPGQGGAGRRLPAQHARRARGPHAEAGPSAARKAPLLTTPTMKVIPFGGPTGPLRLLGKGLGDQGGWLLPFALLGLLGLALWVVADRRTSATGPPRRNPALAALIVLGGWFLVEAGLLSFSKGIVHPYYVSALGPGAAAMTGAGAVAFARLAQRSHSDWRRLLAPLAAIGTVAAQVVLLHREHYMHWFVPVLLLGAGAAIAALLLARRHAPWAVALTLGLLLVAPAAYSSTTWRAPVEGTFPAAGPHQARGYGGVGLKPRDVTRDRLLIAYARAHGGGSRWLLLTDASPTAAPFILLGADAGALAGYSGTDPAVDGPKLARMVSRRLARYVVLGGEFSSRGGNLATAAVLRTCRELAPETWQGVPPLYPHSLVLFDCAGRERKLAAP